MPCAKPLAASALTTLISVHDLMPETMPEVRRTLRLLEQQRLAPVTLLVVPGRDWTPSGIDELRALQRAGYQLAGHGWRHQAARIGGLYHRLHSLFLSRRVAEHLALDPPGIMALIQRCHAWFPDNGLEPPTLYVPPAWAMGAIPAQRLTQDSPFRLYERFDAVIDLSTGQRRRLPLLGYEADNRLRAPVLRLWNTWNRRRAVRSELPLRIGIHPRDLDLGIADDLLRDLQRSSTPISYDALFRPAEPATA